MVGCPRNLDILLLLDLPPLLEQPELINPLALCNEG